MLSELYAKFIEQDRKEQRLEKLILRHKRALQKLQERGGWWNCCLIPLADKLSEILNMPYKIYGPFGLGAETSIYFFPDGKCGDIVKSDTYGITLHPAYKDGEGSCAERFYLTYNTGERTNTYPEGTIGYWNGFNNVEAPLPDDIDKVVEIVKKNFCAGKEC